jgi:hypothetical protein
MIHAEYEAAVERFEADLELAAGAARAAMGTHRLRRRAARIYRNALTEAAGRPHDPRWNILEIVVDAFVERIRDVPLSPDAAIARKRLELLRAEETEENP